MTQVPQLRTAVSPLLLEILEGSARCYFKMVLQRAQIVPAKVVEGFDTRHPVFFYFNYMPQKSVKCPMKLPKRIQPLIDDGLVDEVIGQLMSGKEATVYIVRCGSEISLCQSLQGSQQTQLQKSSGISGRPQGA